MALPNFLGIGAQKCGTTWLARNLARHPEIWMPPRKELHYFDYRIEDPPAPLSLYRARFFEHRQGLWRTQAKNRSRAYLTGKRSLRDAWWDLKYLIPRGSDGWYASLFDAARGKVTGEITPAYAALDDEAVAQIRELMPEAKVIFMVRNPMERAFSHAVMKLDKRANRTGEDTEEEEFFKHFGRGSSLLKSGYLPTLERWRRFYPEEQIFVGFLEDVNLYPARILARLYRFVGVNPGAAPRARRSRANSRAQSGATMSADQAVHLARTYREDLVRLDERFGGYASFWRFCAERLVEGPPEEGVPYPLWESPMWEEWAANQKPRPGLPEAAPQSGALSSLFN